jgi:hypothetical protein
MAALLTTQRMPVALKPNCNIGVGGRKDVARIKQKPITNSQ